MKATSFLQISELQRGWIRCGFWIGEGSCQEKSNRCRMMDTSPQQTKELQLCLNSVGIGLGGSGSLKDHVRKVGHMQ